MALEIPFKDHLLPPNATDAERAVATVAKRVTDVPTPIDIVKRPLETPANFLPFLAWERSVDIWDHDWPEAKKRAVTESALRLHQRKGTAPVIRRYVEYAGGRVIHIERPPGKIYSGAALSKEQREAWLAKLPQVRVWQQWDRAPAQGRMFSGGQLYKSFFETTVTYPNDSIARTRRRARWVVDGVETDIRVEPFEGSFRLFITAPASPMAVFSKQPFGGRFFLPSTAAQRIVTIAPVSLSPWRTAAVPSLRPISVEPERIAQRAPRGPGVFCGDPVRGHYFVPSTAAIRLFERYPVANGTAPVKPPSIQFMGIGRYGAPAHTAVLRTSIPTRASPVAAGEGAFAPRTRFWLPHDPRPLDRVCRAVQSAKRLTDRIKLDLGPRPRFLAGQLLLAGDSMPAY